MAVTGGVCRKIIVQTLNMLNAAIPPAMMIPGGFTDIVDVRVSAISNAAVVSISLAAVRL